MKIRSVEAAWLRCPLPAATQHVSDFGRIETVDTVLVTVTTDEGLVGYGEAKPSVGSAGSGAALAAIVAEEFGPRLIGQDATQRNQIWQDLFNGSRAGLAARAGRSMPILGRRGPHVSAIGGIDLALWDLAGKAAGAPVLELVGGACRPSVRAYGSGGWAPTETIGDELGRYVAEGFTAVKMRIGAMDASIATSVARATAARAALGDDVAIMVDAHGTMNVAEAKRFTHGCADLDLRFVEEPVGSDDRRGLAEVRHASPLPIAAGESELTAFDYVELIEARAVDVIQPDMAIAGGFTEGLRVSALASAHRVELAPHCWGSAISFQAARALAFASPAGVLVEVPMGGRPLLDEMADVDLTLHDGQLRPATGPGWGVEPDPDFVTHHTVRP